MALNPIPQTVSPDLLATVNPKKAAAADGSVEADTNKFMTLLVTQLKNQDPMNPLDNAQITSQLAQLSTVTGVNKLNTTLESLKSSYQSSEAMAATNMIGHGVLVEGDYVNLASGKGIMGVDLASAADSVKLIVTDPTTGKDVQTIDFGAHAAGTIPVAWDGVPDGATSPLKDGKYLIRVVATQGGAALKDAKALSFDSVASVTTSAANGVKLNLPTRGTVSMSDIKQIL
ncbi:flagellar hook assembly protein FlgD [Massilia sp. R2A-15]|uniref:flagellar hook assembly protein FlgD n=1 Tax=Massilia sp. R2A-15 TaxID=3064278 RepID=UPI002737554F|nr:flagellar hook assembly protein FlgD [Massilia sp. R2A-15]WLI88003.1 flagellar hook assembly protein FlgD [Massilia sp. R2A-15]